MPPDSIKPLVVIVSIDVAAGIAGRTPATIRKWIREGRITAQRKLGRFLLDREEIERFAQLADLPPVTAPAKLKKRR